MIKPINGYILIKPIENTITETESGIILPDIKEDENVALSRGEVIETDSDLVEKGDVILFSKFIPMDVNYNKEKYVLLREEGIYAVITK